MRADIHDGQEHKRSVQGPDTEAQDLSPPNHHFPLATRGRPIQWGQGTKSLRGRPNRELSYHTRELLSLNQLCQRNCCALRAEPCEITTLTRAGPGKFIASLRAPRRSFGSSTKKPLPPKASITLS